MLMLPPTRSSVAARDRKCAIVLILICFSCDVLTSGQGGIHAPAQ
jgi:hypothetical protein